MADAKMSKDKRKLKHKELLLLAIGNPQLTQILQKNTMLRKNYEIASRSVNNRDALVTTIDEVKPNKVLIFDTLPPTISLKEAGEDKEKSLSLTKMFQQLKMDKNVDNENIVFVSTHYKTGSSVLSAIVQKGFFNILIAGQTLQLTQIIDLLKKPNTADDVNDLAPEIEIPDDESKTLYKMPERPQQRIIYTNEKDENNGELSDSVASDINGEKSVAELAKEADKKYNKDKIKKLQREKGKDRDAALVAAKMGKKSSENKTPYDEFAEGKLTGSIEKDDEANRIDNMSDGIVTIKPEFYPHLITATKIG